MAITATSNVNKMSQAVLIGLVRFIIILLSFERVQRSTRNVLSNVSRSVDVLCAPEPRWDYCPLVQVLKPMCYCRDPRRQQGSAAGDAAVRVRPKERGARLPQPNTNSNRIDSDAN
jgi:hypothetical protein